MIVMVYIMIRQPLKYCLAVFERLPSYNDNDYDSDNKTIFKMIIIMITIVIILMNNE